MKKWFLGFFVAIMAVSLAAFAGQPEKKEKTNLPSMYYWLATDELGNVITPQHREDGEEPDDVAAAFGDCDPGPKYCAKAFVTATNLPHTPYDIRKQ